MLEDSNASVPSYKRQKKVCFTAGRQEEDAPVVQEVATPARIQMPRKATPFKSYASMEEDDDDDDAMEDYTPSHSNKKSYYPPLPEPVDLLSHTFAEPPDMGPAVAGDTRRIYNILLPSSKCLDASIKTPKKGFATHAQASCDSEIVAALQKVKEENETKEAAALLEDKGADKSTKQARAIARLFFFRS